MTFSLDDLGSPGAAAKVVEEPFWVDVRVPTELDWGLLDWKLDDLTIRVLFSFFQCTETFFFSPSNLHSKVSCWGQSSANSSKPQKM